MHSGIGESGDRQGRISLRLLDRLMQGELPEAEAAALREAVSRSAEAREYIAKYEAMGSDLTLDRIGAQRKGFLRAAAARLREGLGETLRGRAGRPGLALACLLLAGLGTWTWQARNGADSGQDRHASGFRAKGGEAGVRLVIGGTEFEPGQLAPAGSGDTLEVTYRSPRPLRARIWFREEGGEPAAMDGKAEALAWEASMGWSRAPDRIVLEGEWKRQTVWVLWSPGEFSEKEARQAVDGKSPRADLRAEAFRLARPQ